MTTTVLRFYRTELIEAPHHHTDQLYHDHYYYHHYTDQQFNFTRGFILDPFLPLRLFVSL